MPSAERLPVVLGRAELQAVLSRLKGFPSLVCQLLYGSGGYDIRTIQELLDNKDVATTMIYTHVLNRGPAGVRSPLDR